MTGRQRERLALLMLLLLAAAIRLVGIVNQSPPGVAHDEVANWLIDRAILDEGEHGVYFTRAYGHEAGYHYIQAGFLALLGDNLLAMRLPSAFAGLLGVAVAYALTKLLFGRRAALLGTAVLATLFWPVFYSRLALRAILLPLTAGLAAYFWWRGWLTARRGTVFFLLAGLFAGASLYTYLAARALPIFFGLFIGYLLLLHRQRLRRKWRGVLLFIAAFLLVALPLVLFLRANPGAEFRVAEVSRPLQELRDGRPGPVLTNGVRLLGMFGFVGDPLWREGVPSAPVFGPVLALLFYVGLAGVVWRWRDARAGFLLLWLAAAITPSLVTINAPSHIRAIMLLPLLPLFPVLALLPAAWGKRASSHKKNQTADKCKFDITGSVIHSFPKLSTVNRELSTKIRENIPLIALTGGMFFVTRTAVLIFTIWPTGGDVPFVWQTALAQTAAALREREIAEPVALAGWSPETLDRPSLMLLMSGREAAASHFQPEEGTLILPAAANPVVVRPLPLPLHPYWEARMIEWGAAAEPVGSNIHYRLPAPPVLEMDVPAAAQFGGELHLLGVQLDACGREGICALVTAWRVTAVPTAARQLFLHILDADGEIVAESYAFDRQDPQGLWSPHWQEGDLLLQRHQVVVGEAATALRLGWFDPYTCSPGPCVNLATEAGEPFLLLPLPSP